MGEFIFGLNGFVGRLAGFASGAEGCGKRRDGIAEDDRAGEGYRINSCSLKRLDFNSW